MDVFRLRDQLIDDFWSYTSSFLKIRDPQISTYVDSSIEKGLLWPDPRIQLNPAFEPGAEIGELVDEDILHPECNRIFRRDKSPVSSGKPLRLHRHQTDAIHAAKTSGNYVLTTGTGSGKSLAYIIPIVDHVLRRGSGNGIQAIVVYPMNALANSQFGELEKFLCEGYPEGQPPVTFERYTGQEDEEKRREIWRKPPDILLTNYVMLELILTRPHERGLVDAAQGLQFLVLDELHTYRGRQGADVALLVRRLREACQAPDLQCVGTSATLAAGGTFDEQRADVASVASTLFGGLVKPEHVIGETLRRATQPCDPADPAFRQELTACVTGPAYQPPTTHAEFVADPLARWLETTFGVVEDPESGLLVRPVPRPIWDAQREEGAAFDLHELTGVRLFRCRDVIRQGLLTGITVADPEGPWNVFAFRLHQFIGKGDTVYATLEDPGQRHLTVTGQRYISGEAGRRLLLPLVFCRQCGQEYYCVRATTTEDEPQRFHPRDLGDRLKEADSVPGFLYFSEAKPWPDDLNEQRDRLPEDWLEPHQGGLRIRPYRRKQLPKAVWVAADGSESADGIKAYWIDAPFRFCLHCGVAYTARTRSDFGKLATLGSEGRSTATTILSLSVIRSLRNDPDPTLAAEARKLLSFTDNRQDASLQAGHFNDFIVVGRLRAALYRAVAEAGANGLTHDVVPQRVFEALALPFDSYAADATVRFGARSQTEKALRDVLGYRIYRDLERGWRITSPNLEQTGLLRIDYDSLDELADAEDIWADCHPGLSKATPEQRAAVCRALLDELRRRLVIHVDYLDRDFQESLQLQGNQRLIGQWALDENEPLSHGAIAYPRSSTPEDYDGNVFLSGRSAFGQYLRRTGTFPHLHDRPGVDETEEIIRQLLAGLREAGLVEVVDERGSVPGYQLQAAGMRWLADDGTTPLEDPLRVTAAPEGGQVNPFFLEFYRRVAAELTNLEAHEHTAQVSVEDREAREDDFRRGDLPILYCSPTMELGVDIAQLNVVNLRNVPPTPANYAQRSGRAGRSGQPALVFTYCTVGSPHDQYFFRRTEQMVAGAVAPPRLDLANEDLIRAHVQAVWLAETGVDLRSSLADVLDLSGEDPSLELRDSVVADINNPRARQRGRRRADTVLATLAEDLGEAPWFDDDWLDRTINQAPHELDRACERWRGLYRAAMAQRNQSHRVAGDASASPWDRRQAENLWREAGTQMRLLSAADSRSLAQSDFYSYRYFASEGFLPGYSFPRLPLSAFIPGSRRRDSHDYVSRPRFLAISEFGPRAVIYHEGAVYQIHRVVMPVAERADDEPLVTGSAKLCGACGYLHPLAGQAGPDVCERCSTRLGFAMRDLFRLQNVITRRRARITSDEEERLRLGYELRTAVRFADHGGRPHRELAQVRQAETDLAAFTYGHASTLWRLNLGWSRRENKDQLGFVLDYDKGTWARHEQVTADEDLPDDPRQGRTRRVIPFVEDRRNCLLIEPVLTGDDDQRRAVAASLQAALKNGIQVAFQLEDTELAAEPLPDREDRRVLLLYEAAEGGAGVLRRLIRERGALAAAARAALEVCHFDPETGADRGGAPAAEEPCEAACYDCLLSYSNQVDHDLLDRHLIRDLLLRWRDAAVLASPSEAPRGTHSSDLRARCDSDLEREFIDWLDARGLRLPTHAQYRIDEADTRADFYYADASTVVYVDGPHHDHADRAAADEAMADRLLDLGYEVIRIRHDDDWEAVVRRYPSVFGGDS